MDWRGEHFGLLDRVLLRKAARELRSGKHSGILPSVTHKEGDMAEEEEVLISELIRDRGLYPRNKLDMTHVRRLREAYEAGADIPAIKADRKSKLVVDGWHRCEAREQLSGDQATIKVEWQDFESTQEAFIEAAKIASDSKLPLSPYDQQRIVVRAGEMGVSLEQVALALSVPAETLQKRIALSGPTAVNGLEPARIPLKRPLRHLEGRELTPGQVEANETSDGMVSAYHAQQIINRIEADAINWDAEGTTRKLSELRDLLNKTLPVEAEVA